MTNYQEIQQSFELAFEALGEPDEPDFGALRAGYGDDGAVMTIVERDGVLHVEQDAVDFNAEFRTMRADETVVWERQLRKLDRNEIGGWLTNIDTKLTPARGIRKLVDGAWTDTRSIQDSGRVLLVVHGTFSNSDNVLSGIRQNPRGDAFLNWAESHYDEVLAFDHPTVGISPMLNAHALDRALGGTGASLDIVTHSRGGLVARWWLESFDDGDPESRRVVFVGSPLAGTGLAAPPRIKATLSLLANISSALGTAAGMVPLTVVVGGIFKVVASITKLASKTPAVDAAVAMIPGFAAQSRVANNQELIQQRQYVGAWQDRYFAVQSNFESEKPGWQFWKHFRPSALVDRGADIVFDGQNDLVVDTGSMRELSENVTLPDEQVLDYGTNEEVHHTNYFEQPQTLEFIQERFTL